MGGELEQELRDFFGALDRMELEPLVERITDDMQAVDEISRGWTRGKNEFEAKAVLLMEAISDVRTEITDIVEHMPGGETGRRDLAGSSRTTRTRARLRRPHREVVVTGTRRISG